MSRTEISRMLKRREGYCQFSAIFAPIEGIRMITKELTYLTSDEKREFDTVWSGYNENKHLQILEKLLKMGADPNTQDRNGYTPLHHIVKFANRWQFFVQSLTLSYPDILSSKVFLS